MATLLAAMSLLFTSLGTAPIAAAQRDAEPVAPLILAAEEDPSPSPQPTPSPTPRPTPWPTPKGIKGLDVSHWNGSPNFDQLSDEGMRFVFSKASQGTSFEDDKYARNTRAARAAGLVAGAYHFFDYTVGGKAQALHFLDTLERTSGLGWLMPLVVDVETFGSLGTPNKQKARTRLHAMLDKLYAKTGRYPMIYTSRYMWEQVVGGPTGFGDYPLWVACWKCDSVPLPTGWSGWDFWQVGQFKFDSGKKLDGNVWRANADALGKLRQRPMRLDGGETWTTDRAVLADLRGYDGTEVRYAIGDGPFGPWQPYRKWFGLDLSRRQGKQEVGVQLRSFRGVTSPVLRDTIKLDSEPPTMWGPRVSLHQGTRVQKGGAKVPFIVDTGGKDASSGLARTRLTAACSGNVVKREASTERKLTMTVRLRRSGCVLTAAATDKLGLQATRQFSPSVQLIDLKPGNKAVGFVRGWTKLKGSEALGGTLARADAPNATMKIRIDGSQFALVVRRGPAGGRLQVIVDGKLVDTIDLYAKDGDPRRVAYVRDVPRGKHLVKLRATGTGRSASTSSIVWADAVLVLDRRK